MSSDASRQVITPAPVRKTVTVKAPPAKAFDVFTASFDAWWPKTHHIGKCPTFTSRLEPFAGGRWYEEGDDGSTCEWGKVLVWEPPTRLVLAWQIKDWEYNPDVLTEVEVTFAPLADGSTRVELEHRHLERLGDGAEQSRAIFDSPGGWSGILHHFRSVAEAA